MRGIIRRTGDFGTRIGVVLAAFALVSTIGAAATAPALAQDRNYNERGRDYNERGRSDVRAPERHNARDDARAYHGRDARAYHGREVRSYRPAYGYDSRSYGYNPPPIDYAPPAPSGGINLIIPFHFR
jgi:hypothetical protein